MNERAPFTPILLLILAVYSCGKVASCCVSPKPSGNDAGLGSLMDAIDRVEAITKRCALVRKIGDDYPIGSYQRSRWRTHLADLRIERSDLILLVSPSADRARFKRALEAQA